ncbi:MAG: 6-phosphofructokinase 1 [Verrucomicrobia bacterium]|nr:MAG: 6-phosphofructokinase 1 [Verrucomicrobiota bacterium]
METNIHQLGACRFVSPLTHSSFEVTFRSDSERVLYDHLRNDVGVQASGVSFELAGPRENLFFDPTKTTAAIVTCGGLCPGLNDIIRGIVTQCHNRYGISRVFGFRYGYQGLIARHGFTPMVLRPESVAQIHNFGGSILGNSRGHQDIGEMVDLLEEMKVDIFFVVGGDGTLRGASAIAAECSKRGLKKAVVGIPKTIDNDIMYLDKSFGFETAFAMAVQAVRSTYVESTGSLNGIGVLKLMGRDSGFIACYAALAGSNVDFVLIPEVNFELEGSGGLLEALHYRVAKRRSAVVVVSEGAGQHLLPPAEAKDASGNVVYGDIGAFLRDRITASFKERRVSTSVKYIDPSYLIRSVPANAQDNVYCSQLAQHAVHAAMAGKTSMLVGRWHGAFVHLPLDMVTHGRRKVDPQGELWNSVLESTGQPARLY